MLHKDLHPYWLSFTIRNDCCLPEDVIIFDNFIKKHGVPAVCTFWTKQPVLVAQLFESRITRLREKYGTFVSAMMTLNNYGKDQEPGRQRQYDCPEQLMKLVDKAYYRADPLLKGYTRKQHLQQLFEYARDYHNIDGREVLEGIKLSFGTFHRHGIGELYTQRFPHIIQNPTLKQRTEMINSIMQFGNEICKPYQPSYIYCAESSNMKNLEPKPCYDIDMIIKYAPEIGQYFYEHRTKQKGCVPNRKGCSCFPYMDGGKYASWSGSHPCPNQCVYCYAKGK